MGKDLTKVINLALPAGSLDAYTRSVFAIPMLSAEEERELAISYRDNNDLEAVKRLVMAHLRFVVSVARSYSGYGLNQADLIQEGNVGLMKAAKRFDPERKVRLVSFAVHWIRAEIHEFVIANWRIVKVATTKAQRKLFFNLRKNKKTLGWLKQAERETIADTLDVPVKDVAEMESRLSGYDVHFEADDDDDSDEQKRFVAPAHYLMDVRADPADVLEKSDWSQQLGERLTKGLNVLDQRSRNILEQRWLSDKKVPLRILAQEYQVSMERIRQIEKSAIDKLKELMTADSDIERLTA